MKRTNTLTPIPVVLITSLVCLLGAPRDASSGVAVDALLQATGATLLMSAACVGAAVFGSRSEAVDDEYARQGWLVGVGASYAIETFQDNAESDFQSVLEPRTVSLSVDNSFGINGRAGYRCHRRFSAEIEVEWLDRFKADVSTARLGKIATVDLEPVVVTTNMKGYLLTGRYQPFLLVGVGVMTAEAKLRDTAGLELSASERETDLAMRFGGGIDLYATKHVVVSVEADYVLPFGDLEDLDYVSIGMGFQYRF